MLHKFCFLYYLIYFYIFLFLAVFNNLFASPVDNENTRLRLAHAIPTGVPTTVANDATEMLPLVADKTINSRSLISAIKLSLISLILFSLNCWLFKFDFSTELYSVELDLTESAIFKDWLENSLKLYHHFF